MAFNGRSREDAERKHRVAGFVLQGADILKTILYSRKKKKMENCAPFFSLFLIIKPLKKIKAEK